MAAGTCDHGTVIAYVVRYLPCDTCGGAFGPDDVRVALHDDAAWFYAATCPVCRTQQAITVYDRPPYTRLQSTAPVALAEITRDEVDGWAAFLAAFSGDMIDLLALR